MITKVSVSETHGTIIELRQQANYWQAQHARAIERGAAWKKRALEAEKNVRHQTVQLVEKYQQIEALKARIGWLQQQLFGRKTEQIKSSARDSHSSEQKYFESPDKRRQRGKQPGAKGHGRKLHKELPTEEVDHDLPQDEKSCSTCGKPYIAFSGTEDSDEIHWEVRLIRRVHKQADRSYRYCGRIFTAEDLDLIRRLIDSNPERNRARLSRLVCDTLAWLRPDGRRKDMSCRVAMLRMHRDGLINLPPPRQVNGNGHTRSRLTGASDPQKPISLPVDTFETFVEKDRFQGTCYRAANWIQVGETQGRGKLDRNNRRSLPVKNIFLSYYKTRTLLKERILTDISALADSKKRR
ncbi:MAG: hypothetical protein V1789_00955 [PVC group bacterium]